MRLNHVLHPEIICNIRGDQKLREFYKECLSRINYDAAYFFKSETLASLDENMREHFAMTWKFRNEWATKQKPKVYYVGKDFCRALVKYDKDIPLDRLPSRFFGYFQFPKETVFDDTDEIDGAYIFVGASHEAPVVLSEYGKRVIWISYVCKDQVDRPKPLAFAQYGSSLGVYNFVSVGRLLLSLENNPALTQALNQIPTRDFGSFANMKKDAEKRAAVFRLLCNLVIYTESAEPELEFVPTHHHLSNSKKAAVSSSLVNETFMPLTLVSYGYRSERIYSVDSTWVEPFPRWQKCGPGLSQLKLIWVKGHERRFEKVVDSSHGDHNLR